MEYRHISKSKFKSQPLQFFQEIEKTEKPIIITDNKRPVLKIIPHVENLDELFYSLRNSAIKYDGPTEPGLDDWKLLHHKC